MANRYGDGAVYKDKSKGLWVGTAELGRGPDGRRLRRKVSAKTKPEARRLVRELVRQVQEGTVPPAPALSSGTCSPARQRSRTDNYGGRAGG